MNILVTGGAGFIASHITDKLVALGHKVVIVDNMSTGRNEYINNSAKFYRADIRDKNIADILVENKIEVIDHHAAQINLRNSVADPQMDIDINITGSVNLFQAALKSGVRKIIFASSGGAIYGDDENLPSAEEHDVNPRSPYGINKLAVEKYLHFYKVVHGIDYVCLRYANAYGPRQSTTGESGVVAIFCDALLSGKQPVINGNGNQTRDYVFVSDIVQANVLALGKTNFNIYNVGTAKETTVNYVFDKLNQFAGTKFTSSHRPAKLGEQIRSSLSSSRIEKDLGWRPEVNADKGLELTFEFFKNRK